PASRRRWRPASPCRCRCSSTPATGSRSTRARVSTSPESDPSEEGEPLLGTRRQARELALSLLYEADTKDADPAVVLADFPIDPDPFAADLVAGVGEHQDEIDGVIRRFAKDWTLERMPVVDRNLLRIGV